MAYDLPARPTNARSESSIGDALQSLVTDLIFHGRRTRFKAWAAERHTFLGEVGVKIDTEKAYRCFDLFDGALGRVQQTPTQMLRRECHPIPWAHVAPNGGTPLLNEN